VRERDISAKLGRKGNKAHVTPGHILASGKASDLTAEHVRLVRARADFEIKIEIEI